MDNWSFSPWGPQPGERLRYPLTWTLPIVWRRTVTMRGSPSAWKGCLWAGAYRISLTHWWWDEQGLDHPQCRYQLKPSDISVVPKKHRKQRTVLELKIWYQTISKYLGYGGGNPTSRTIRGSEAQRSRIEMSRHWASKGGNRNSPFLLIEVANCWAG